MNVPLWASELARMFWTRAGETELFPRNLRRAIRKAVPLAVVPLPALSVHLALDWLRKCGMIIELSGEDRPLRACLAARGGQGIALVDGSDEEAEQRVSLAHELAHFLRDYWSLRQRICKRLGMATLAVLDGERQPSFHERFYALLRDVPLGFHLHLMERDCDGKPATAVIAQLEADADRLAYELLAPAEHVLGHEKPRSKQALVHRLQTVYGLPAVQASRYAGVLLPPRSTDPLLLRLRSSV